MSPRIPRRSLAARLVLVGVSTICTIAAAGLFVSSGIAAAAIPLLALALLLTVGAGSSGMVASGAMRTVIDPGPEFLAECGAYQEALRQGDADRAAAIHRDLWDAAAA